MKKFTIKDVGLNMESIAVVDGVVTGEGCVYTEADGDLPNEEFVDDFEFNYNIYTQEITIDNLDLKTFGKFLDEITEILIENIETNVMSEYFEEAKLSKFTKEEQEEIEKQKEIKKTIDRLETLTGKRVNLEDYIQPGEEKEGKM